MNQLDEWVQDALDLIEYARGRRRPWGSVRAPTGTLTVQPILGIGNENWGRYHKRYSHKAIKEKYPDIKLISGRVAYDGPDYDIAKRWAESIGVDVFDEHVALLNGFSNADRYDDYERGEMVIFVGGMPSRHGQEKQPKPPSQKPHL